MSILFLSIPLLIEQFAPSLPKFVSTLAPLDNIDSRLPAPNIYRTSEGKVEPEYDRIWYFED
jgi:hypothetical protein